MLARVYSLLGVTAYLHAIGDAEEQEQQAKEEQEMQEALIKFAEVDAIDLWEANSQVKTAVPKGHAENISGERSSDVGVVVSRKPIAQEDAALASFRTPTKEISIKSRYHSKIRSSPLILSEEESSRSAKTLEKGTGEPLNKKRKLKFDEKAQKKPQETGTIPRKKTKKSSNAIDALFAGLG